MAIVIVIIMQFSLSNYKILILKHNSLRHIPIHLLNPMKCVISFLLHNEYVTQAYVPYTKYLFNNSYTNTYMYPSVDTNFLYMYACTLCMYMYVCMYVQLF